MADKYVVEPHLNSAVKHLLGRGKLYRPRLALATFEAITGKQPPEYVVKAVTPLELIHTFTLIHDDLPCMDDAELRRGLTSVHVEFGEALGVLAGDSLSVLAFQVLADEELALTADERLSLIQLLSNATQKIVEGQVGDLSAEGQTLEVDEILKIHHKKTGALLSASCGFGAVLAGASDNVHCTLEAAGVVLGSLFQLRDDLIAAETTENDAGKSHTDQRLAKSTLVSVLGIEVAKAHGLMVENDILEMVRSVELLKPEPLLSVFSEAFHRTH